MPKELDLHLIVDNYCPHKHAKVKAWLAQWPRFHFHYTPTYASWLNQVERCWFGLITQKAIRRGSFASVKELISKIQQFVAAFDKTKVPFKWTAISVSILGEAPETLFANLRDTVTDQLVVIGCAAWDLSDCPVAYRRAASRYIHKAEEITEGCIQGAAALARGTVLRLRHRAVGYIGGVFSKGEDLSKRRSCDPEPACYDSD